MSWHGTTEVEPNHEGATAPVSIKRTPKACAACRQSKVRCDGLKPCSRCRNHRKECNYAERPRDPVDERFERLEQEIYTLREQIANLQTQQILHTSVRAPLDLSPISVRENGDPQGHASHPSQPGATSTPHALATSPTATSTAPVASPVSLSNDQFGRKRKRSGLQMRQEPPVDFVRKGLLNEDHARSCFKT